VLTVVLAFYLFNPDERLWDGVFKRTPSHALALQGCSQLQQNFKTTFLSSLESILASLSMYFFSFRVPFWFTLWSKVESYDSKFPLGIS